MGLRSNGSGAALAFCFSLFAVLASFGIGNLTQANSIADAVKHHFWHPGMDYRGGYNRAGLLVLMGGIKSIGRVCGFIVPIMAVFYFLAALVTILMNHAKMSGGNQ